MKDLRWSERHVGPNWFTGGARETGCEFETRELRICTGELHDYCPLLPSGQTPAPD